MRRTLVFIVGIGVLLAFVVYLLAPQCRLQYGDFKQPLRVVDVRAMPDGGTLEIQLADAEGRMLVVRRNGSLAVAPSHQDLQLVSYFFGVPLSCGASKGSHAEATTKALLQSWLGGRLTSEQKTALERGNPEALRSVPYDVVAAFDLVSWLERRQ